MRPKCKRCTRSRRQVEKENHGVIWCCRFKQTHDPQSCSENIAQAQSYPWCHEWWPETGIMKRNQVPLLFKEMYQSRQSIPLWAKLCRASRRLSSVAIRLYCSAMKSRVMSAVASGRGSGREAALVFLPLLHTAGINLDDSLRSCQAHALHQPAAGEARHLVHQCERSQRRLKIHSGGWCDITRSAWRGIEQIGIKGCGGKACVLAVGLHSHHIKCVFCCDQFCFDPSLSFEGENLKQHWSVATICRFDVYAGNEKETLMDVVSDIQLHTGERHCRHLIYSEFWNIKSAFKSISNNSLFLPLHYA